MANWKIDDQTGDLVMVNGNFVIVDGIDAIKQALLCRFRTFLGEWFLDTSLGVPYFEKILIKSPIFAVVNEILKTVVLNTPGVVGLIFFQFAFDTAARHATLQFSAITTDGVLHFSQTVEIG